MKNVSPYLGPPDSPPDPVEPHEYVSQSGDMTGLLNPDGTDPWQVGKREDNIVMWVRALRASLDADEARQR